MGPALLTSLAVLFPGSQPLGPSASFQIGQPVPSLPRPVPAPAPAQVPSQDYVSYLTQLRPGPALPTGFSPFSHSGASTAGTLMEDGGGGWGRGAAHCRNPREIFRWRNQELHLHPQRLASAGACRSALGSSVGILRQEPFAAWVGLGLGLLQCQALWNHSGKEGH